MILDQGDFGSVEMSRFWDNWAYAYRNTRAWGTAIALGGMLIFTLILYPDKPVSVITTTGKVLEVHEVGANDSRFGSASSYIGRIRLTDGGETRIYLHQPIPKPGAEIPLRVEIYADGARYAALDTERWRGY